MNVAAAYYKLALSFMYIFFSAIFFRIYYTSGEKNNIRFKSRYSYTLEGDFEGKEKNLIKLDKEAKNLLKNLQKITQKLSTWKQLHDTSDILNTPIKKLAKLNYPEEPLIYNQNHQLCGKYTLKLLILTITDYVDVNGRNMIRNTWGKLKIASRERLYKLRWQNIFIIGYPVNKTALDIRLANEITFQKDILNIDASDSNTMNVFYSALHWAANGCFFEYLLLTRPNIVLHIPVMHDFLHKGERLDKFLYARTLNKNSTASITNKPNDRTFGSVILSYHLVTNLLPIIKQYSNYNVTFTASILDSIVSILPKNEYSKERCGNYLNECSTQLQKTMNLLESEPGRI